MSDLPVDLPEGAFDLAHRLADAAGAVIRPYFRTRMEIDDKADASPVTIADRESEAAMRRLIEAAFPDHGIFGEEYGTKNADADWVWVLDPIDGTKAFITGMPSFGTLIALCHRGQPVLGVIDQPIRAERWVGCKGRKTTLNGQEVAVRACPGLAHAYLYTTMPEMFEGSDKPVWDRLHDAVKAPRYGADCYAYAVLATGFVDLVVETLLKPYDFLALVPVIEGAGGVITDWSGRPLTLASGPQVVAAGDRRVHDEARAMLAAAAQP